MLRMISHVLTLHLVVLYELPDNSAQFLSFSFFFLFNNARNIIFGTCY